MLHSTNPIKDVLRGVAITGAVRELDAVIRQHHMYAVGQTVRLPSYRLWYALR